MPRIYSGRKKCCEYLIGRSSNRKRSSTVNVSKSLAFQQMNKRIYECDDMQTTISEHCL